MVPLIEITRRAADQTARGVLWIFSNEILKKPADVKPGDWCIFQCQGRPVGAGYFNAHSLIAGRLLTFDSSQPHEHVLSRRIETAFQARAGFGAPEARRLVYSESDLLPGLVADCYADIVVLQSNTAGMDPLLPLLEKIIPEIFKKTFNRPLRGLVLRGDARVRQLEGVPEFVRVVSGDERTLTDVEFDENGVTYHANLLEGQKTGFFLDQRDNRLYLGQQVKKLSAKKVLDLFSYSGGWGLRALKEGADHVTFVDESADALELIKKAFATNGFPLTKGTFVKMDAFDFLEKNTEPFDIVVADPPAMIPTKKLLGKGSRAYEKLNRLSIRHTTPGGMLISSSCSYHLSEEDFLTVLSAAFGKEGALGQVLYRGGQPSDHPVLLSMPETRYLKCLGIRKIDRT